MLDPLLRHAENLDRYTELRSHANLNTRLVIRKGAVIENAQAETRGVSARCYRGGPFGFASRVGDSDRAIEAVVAEASANAALARHGSAHAGPCRRRKPDAASSTIAPHAPRRARPTAWRSSPRSTTTSPAPGRDC